MLQASRVRAPRAFATVSSSRRGSLVVRAQRKDITQGSSTRAAGAVLLAAATLALNVGPAVDPTSLLLQPARADDTSEELLAPYQRRQRDLERRREMLRQAREQAEMKAGGEAEAPALSDADAAIEAANAERRAEADRLGAQLRSSAAATYESSTSTGRYGRSFGGSSSPAPAPAAAPAQAVVAEPVAAPKPSGGFFGASRQEQPKAEPVVEVKRTAPVAAPAPAKKAEEPPQQQQQQPAGKQKRRGPLPLFLAQLLVLGGFVGVGLAATKYEKQSRQAMEAAQEKAKELYGMAEAALAKQMMQMGK